MTLWGHCRGSSVLEYPPAPLQIERFLKIECIDLPPADHMAYTWSHACDKLRCFFAGVERYL